MSNSAQRVVFSVALLTCVAAAQFPSGGGGMRPPSTTSQIALDQTQVDLWFVQHDSQQRHGQLESPSASVSKLDLKAPGSARREYEKGLQLLLRKKFGDAVEHLARSIALYPNYVAAHNALGSAYLDMGRNDQARVEFAHAVTLDDHLPGSYLNLGRAELALSHYPAAEEMLQRASAIAPLDLHLLTALTYAQFLNHDFAAAIATARQVHSRKHEGAAIVHYLAATAWQGQRNLQEAKHELQVLLQEDPKSPAAAQARLIVEQIEELPTQTEATSPAISYAVAPEEASSAPGTLPPQFLKAMQELKEQKQVADAESRPECEACGSPGSSGPLETDVPRVSHRSLERASLGSRDWTLHSSVDEVALLFSATDHGKSVSNLTPEEVGIRDDRRPPAAIIGFRNESQLPLRLGLVIDTSASITSRFSFEQGAAANFLRKVVTDQNDLAFVIGFSNSVLVVQDFTNDAKQISHGIGQLAPAGGTAAWDAVTLAAEKLAARKEDRPVARILVVISDGEDNSSDTTLKQAIQSAQRGEVTVYTVSTREREPLNVLAGDQALKLLADRTGGGAFFPGSLGRLNHTLAELQQVVRSRYLISYKPALFQHNGQYRTIDVTAQKDGRKLRIYARRGYYAPADSVLGENF